MKVCSAEEIRKLDQRAIEEFGITEDLLMENAGEAAYYTILKEFSVRKKRFTILCGVGNNGGDGLVVARKLHSSGGEVTVLILGDQKKLKGAAKKNYDIAKKLPIKILHIRTMTPAISNIADSDAIVDALFGTGLARNLEGRYQEAVHLINESRKPVFSIDIPSGINADTGAIMGTAVNAACTITFGLPKRGLLLYPGYDHCGKLYLSHISYPHTLTNDPSMKVQVNEPSPLPQRKRDSYKGDYGKAFFIAGSSRYLGAPYFSALSFLKAGGGLSYLAAPRSISPFLANKGSELILISQEETDDGSIAYSNIDNLLEFTEAVDIVIIGPGLALNQETQRLVRELAAKIEKPVIIDGDGITAIAPEIEKIAERRSDTILTPHLGEMARLIEMSPDQISRDRIGILQKTTKKYSATIVLKGAHSLVGSHDGSVYVNLSGNPGMATAGSGDVLTGTIAALLGAHLPLLDAVRTGVFLHGFSGDLATQEMGEDGVTAQDILDYLPKTLKKYREQYHEVCMDYYGHIFLI